MSQNSAEDSIQAFAIDQCAEKAVIARILHPRAYWKATDGLWGYSTVVRVYCSTVYSSLRKIASRYVGACA